MSYRHCLPILFIVLLSACSSSTNVGEPVDAGFDGTPLPDGSPWPDAGPWWPDAEPADVGPVCPGDSGVLTNLSCDVLEQDCPPGQACYGFIEYVEGECLREIYTTTCLTPGSGGQGDPCHDWCQAGYECFVTGEGTQCLAVCDIHGGSRTCPPGLICGPTDFPGIGACH